METTCFNHRSNITWDFNLCSTLWPAVLIFACAIATYCSFKVADLGDLDYTRQEVRRHFIFFVTVVFLCLKTGHNSLTLFGSFCNAVFL